MNPYVTPAQFKRMATGADISSLPNGDSDLASVLALATEAVNRYCANPKLPQPHDFRGGSITNEQIDYPLGNTFWPGSDKVWVMHRPVKAVSRFFLRVTPDQGVNFDPADLYIHATDGSIEVISLARRLSVFSAGFVPVLGLREPVAELDYTYGWTFTSTGETLWPVSTASGVGYTDYFAANGWWTADPVVVYKNGVVENTGFTTDANEGTVTFSPALSSTDVVTLDYKYTLPDAIAQATALIASNAINANIFSQANFRGLAGVRVEETELRFPMRGQMVSFEELVDPRAQSLLNAYKHFSWA